MNTRSLAPTPNLRIVAVEGLLAHEEHDNQRSAPLIARLEQDEYVINPPIVAPLSEPDQYVILDGANRCYAFQQLGYPHIIVQVAPYDSGYVELETWRHVVSGWEQAAFLSHLEALPNVILNEGQDKHAIAHVMLRGGELLALTSPLESTAERNKALCEAVRVYQRNAKLYRTALAEPEEVWTLYPEAIALVLFPHYHPADIYAAAQPDAHIPPGVSRHIIHGRALQVNYPMMLLRDTMMTLADKNAQLTRWLQEKLAKRKLRYYAEATYQFGE